MIIPNLFLAETVFKIGSLNQFGIEPKFRYRRMLKFRGQGTIYTILKNMKNSHEGVLLLVKLQASACNFTKSNSMGDFYVFEIAQMVPIRAKRPILSGF